MKTQLFIQLYKLVPLTVRFINVKSNYGVELYTRLRAYEV